MAKGWVETKGVALTRPREEEFLGRLRNDRDETRKKPSRLQYEKEQKETPETQALQQEEVGTEQYSQKASLVKS